MPKVMAYDSWDVFYLKMARLVSTKSKDPSTQTGAVIVRPDRTVCSIGFNGFPQCMPDKPEWYANRDDKYSRIVHSEMNALIFSHEVMKGYTLYEWPFASCDRCCVMLLQAGITRFVYPELPEDKKSRWETSLKTAEKYICECGKEAVEVPMKDITCG